MRRMGKKVTNSMPWHSIVLLYAMECGTAMYYYYTMTMSSHVYYYVSDLVCQIK